MKEPLQIVELDVPYCTRTFGVAPCTAAISATTPRKCYNTYATCADVPNFDKGALTLRFAKNQAGLPAGMTTFPALQSVSASPAEINLSGIDPATSPLGKRARVTTTFLDFKYHDTLTDKYRAERVSGAAQFSGIGYDPAQGSFFAKLLARQPYYLGTNLRVRNGYVGDVVSTMPTAHYVVSEWSGPDADGRVTITAKDILDLAENTKAVAPAISNGTLSAAISDTDTTATLVPAGIGNLEYAASGRVCIGREVITFTRVNDVLTLTGRGVDGTAASSHAINDTVQECLYVSAQRLSDTISDLLTTYAGIDAGFVTIADWQDEEDSWLSGLTVTATITKPTGVKSLIGEICQLGVFVWWDNEAQQIRFRCNRPLNPGETVLTVTDERNIIIGSASVDQSEDQRLSAMFVWHGMIDPTGSATDGSNFAKTAIASVDENLYGQDAIREIYTRWFGMTGDDGAAAIIASRLVGRYKDVPKKLSIMLDAKDRASVSMGSIISAQTFQIQDVTGANNPTQMQVNSVDFKNERVMLTAETYNIQGRFAFWMQNPQANYSTATDNEKDTGAFWMDDTINVFPDATGPYVYY